MLGCFSLVLNTGLAFVVSGPIAGNAIATESSFMQWHVHDVTGHSECSLQEKIALFACK